ncbi:MAG: class I SAM-dependent rRNA methyltransferase [Candidatus Methylomirabilales bacterium]
MREGPHIALGPGREVRLLAGHPWIYQSEIAQAEDVAEPGTVAAVYDSRGRFLGQATVNMQSQISGRMLTGAEEPVDRGFLERRLRAALGRLGRSTSGETASRLVFGEGDGLPGLIVDRYADVLAVQILTAGMERLRGELFELLGDLVRPRAIYERSDAPVRRFEALDLRKGFVAGEGETGVWIREGAARFFVEVAEGQKTGFFLDQRDNRQVVHSLAAGREVLDCFCYSGGFAVHAAVGGATSVLGIDVSEQALAWARRSADANGVAERVRLQAGNAFDELRRFDHEGRRFGLIVLDPPAFTKNKAAVPGALRGYKEINLRAMKLLPPGGILVTCSCSYHVDAPTFVEMLRDAGADAHRGFRLLDFRTQAPDHPILLAARETQYLKCAVLEAVE